MGHMAVQTSESEHGPGASALFVTVVREPAGIVVMAPEQSADRKPAQSMILELVDNIAAPAHYAGRKLAGSAAEIPPG